MTKITPGHLAGERRNGLYHARVRCIRGRRTVSASPVPKFLKLPYEQHFMWLTTPICWQLPRFLHIYHYIPFYRITWTQSVTKYKPNFKQFWLSTPLFPHYLDWTCMKTWPLSKRNGFQLAQSKTSNLHFTQSVGGLAILRLCLFWDGEFTWPELKGWKGDLPSIGDQVRSRRLNHLGGCWFSPSLVGGSFPECQAKTELKELFARIMSDTHFFVIEICHLENAGTQ